MTPSHLQALDPRDEAFAEALKQLFKQHPLYEDMYERYHVVRGSALRKAANGGYRGVAGNDRGVPWRTNGYWRKELQDVMARDWFIPPDEVVAIHLLIYG